MPHNADNQVDETRPQLVQESDGRRKFYCRTAAQAKAVPWETLVPGDIVYVPQTEDSDEKVRSSHQP